MTWDWHDIEKESTTERAERRAKQIKDLENLSGKRGYPITDIEGKATDAKLLEAKKKELAANRKALKDARIKEMKERAERVKQGAKTGAKKVAAGAINLGIKDRPTTREQREANFKTLQQRAAQRKERESKPIDYSKIAGRQKRDPRNPKLVRNKKGKLINPINRYVTPVKRKLGQKAKEGAKAGLALGAKAVAAPFKSAGRMAAQAVTGGKRVSSVHPRLEFDSKGNPNPNYNRNLSNKVKTQLKRKKPTNPDFMMDD